ncbi:PSD1 and planctomycete cytochrome C domain-containing protein [Humisphaera borealis]|uniref:PSD1 and planctomycete cytochrome C domain-containing protein n=1 Tax=Humisphaera borealis TaxID=2807512 RepID=UPI0019D280FC|nr:PSD1 and planctomycete cytochrome C domain-containing protein [Humisphaera borealis]
MRAASPVDFDRDVKPILAAHCYECHGTDKTKAGLKLTDRDGAIMKLKSDAVAVVPGKPDASALIARVVTTDVEERMPPEKPALKPAQVATLKQWIAEGAAYGVHWAYRPIVRVDPPAVKTADWAANDIDRFVLASLEGAGVIPSPPADKATLIRRLSLDLTGLPPTPAEVDSFTNDAAPDAYAKLVDRLLASPHFGERWGRHWLDKARYADSDGYEKDTPRPDAYVFRDWVIKAINDDMPFDRFTVEQLAGDLLPGASNEQRIATAFHRQTLTNKEGGADQEQFRVEATFDRAETTGAVWLGLTVGCARCHNHKYDAITQREYYQLFAYFNNGDEVNLQLPGSTDEVRKYKLALAEHNKQVKAIEAQIADGKTPATPAAKKKLEADLAALKKKAPAAPGLAVRVIGQRTANPRPNTMLHRGDFLQPGEQVTPGSLATLHAFTPRDPQKPDRLDLANWLTSPANPLTPRVAANDIWQKLFGKGLVRTPDDFGVRGERPTHPELLDWLADEYRRVGWSRKALIRTIVLSSTYRQSAAYRLDLAERDPENKLLARQNRFRVDGEIVRDATLAASGLLSRKIGGPSVFPALPPDIAALSYANNFRWTTSPGEDRYRRGMYTFHKRTAPHPNLISFDCPDGNATQIQRAISNTPLQALTTLNNESFHEAAQALARRTLAEGGPADDARVGHAFRLCLARSPDATELAELRSLLASARAFYTANEQAAVKLAGTTKSSNAAELAAWVATVRVVLNLDEFLTRE